MKQDFEKEGTLNKLADRVVSEERPDSARQVAKKEESVIVNSVNVRDFIMGMPSLIEDALTATMTPGPDNGKPYGNS